MGLVHVKTFLDGIQTGSKSKCSTVRLLSTTKSLGLPNWCFHTWTNFKTYVMEQDVCSIKPWLALHAHTFWDSSVIKYLLSPFKNSCGK